MLETSPRQIRINKDGVWYYGDEEIFRKEIISLFYENLKQDQAGRYLIELNDERCYIEVEDTPYIVKSVNKSSSEGGTKEIIYINISDGTIEQLDPDTLSVGKDNVLYCRIREGSRKARFSRAAYYQIAHYIENDIENSRYFISLNGQSFYIR
jgi:hypothetical protein